MPQQSLRAAPVEALPDLRDDEYTTPGAADLLTALPIANASWKREGSEARIYDVEVLSFLR